MRYILHYILGTIIGVGIVFGIFYLSPRESQALLTEESSVAAASETLDRSNDQITNSRQNAITRAVRDVAPAVVGINVTQVREYRYRSPFYNDPFFRHFFPDQIYRKAVENLGSGFLISPDGYVLTNEHVVREATQIVVTMTNEQKYDAQIIGFDFDNDVALLKIEPGNLPFIPFGNSDEAIIGEWAIAIGNPFGLFAIHSQPTVTVGVVSATNRDFNRNDEGQLYQDMIQTDASINRGNSGGPLVNSLGELIGMNTMIFTEGGGSIGLGFAIPANHLKKIVTELKNRGSIDRDFWIGAVAQNVNQVIALSLRLPEIKGVIVTDVEPKSPAEKAGLEPTDVIIELNQRPVNNMHDIEQYLRNTDLRVGDTLDMKIIRDSRVKTLTVADRKSVV